MKDFSDMQKLAFVLAISLAATLVPAAHAGLLTAYSPVYVPDYSGGHAQNQNFGDLFTPTVDILVEELGYLDYEGDGLLEDIQVGVFRASDESLLVSTTLNAGPSGTLLDGFRYLAVTPTLLEAGTTYVIAAHVTLNFDITGRTGTDPAYIAFDPALSVTAPANIYEFPNSQFDYPNGGFGSGDFYVGPNFRFSLAPQEVPEPASLTLFALGALGLAAARKRRAE